MLRGLDVQHAGVKIVRSGTGDRITWLDVVPLPRLREFGTAQTAAKEP